MTQWTQAETELLQDRLELLRLRTLLVGALGILGLVVSLVIFLGYGSQALQLVSQMLISDTSGFHVPSNLFQAPADESWARNPVLFQLAFAAIGVGGVAQMTSQILSTVQVRLWLAVLTVLGACIAYTQSDLGSVWHASQRHLVEAVRSKEWGRVEQLSATSKNALAHRYVMAQIGLNKPDTELLQRYGKVLVDQIDDSLMRSGPVYGTQDNGLLAATDSFSPQILKDIDVALYGAPHTLIGLTVTQPTGTSQRGWALARSLISMILAVGGIGAAVVLLLLWKRMSERLRWLRGWITEGG